MVSDQEPRYRLVDANGNIVGSLYGKPDGSIAIQETDSGSDREVALAPDGTFSAPSVETPSLITEGATIDDTYYYAKDDSELDAVLSDAGGGDNIRLGKSNFSVDRTIDSRLSFTGPSMNDDPGASISGTWTIDAPNTGFEKIAIKDGGELIISGGSSYVNGIINLGEITVEADEVMLNAIRRGNVTFATDTEDCIIDTSTGVTVTDNGTNTVGDIA